jgi:hypothetical protein
MISSNKRSEISPQWQQAEALVRAAEALSHSQEWKESARTMRKVRQQLKALSPEVTPEQESRFSVAQQIFMDRRATFFDKGNQKKGAKLRQSVFLLQQQNSQIQESILSCNKTLADFNQQLKSVAQQQHKEQIEQFITESITTLEKDLLNHSQKVKENEEEISRQSSRFCGP